MTYNPPVTSRASVTSGHAQTVAAGDGSAPDTLVRGPNVSSVASVSSATTGYAPTVTPSALAAGVDEELPPESESFGARYAPLELLGEGGMGEVRLHKDGRIGREVAVKIIRKGQGSRSDMRARFLREARVQGQLEHPSLVPVYDLGVHPDSGAFFTMKRVRGMTLEQILEAKRQGDAGALDEYTTRRLLTAFSSVCLAVHFAHARGVVHRDLKPGNVMLGGFGEVYVLDWGLAKLAGAADLTVGKPVDVPTGSGQTAAGAIMGTPGYMPPEQLAGSDVDARADIYALGCILFEILTLETLHPLSSLEATLASTVRGAEARASVRVPEREVPPELEAVCVRATLAAREERFPSARELSDAVESYLDGDRDVALRRAMAEKHTALAAEMVDRAIAGGAGSEEARSAAMSEIGRALAFAPQNDEAMALLVRLLSELPREVPPEAQREIDEDQIRALRTLARGGTFAYLSWLLWIPLLVAMGIEDAWLAVGIIASLLTAAGLSFYVSRRGTLAFGPMVLVLASSSVAIGLSTRTLGPFIVAPTVGLANLLTFAIHGDRKHRAVAALFTGGAIFVPTLLELLGVIPPSYTFDRGALVVHPHMASFDNPTLTWLLLATSTLGLMLAPMFLVGWARMKLTRCERDERVRAWHIRQLLPKGASIKSTLPPPAEVTCASEFLK